MEVDFKYQPSKYMDVKSIAVFGSWNDFDLSNATQMSEINGVWQCKIDINPGEYKYKFIVNNEMKLNDPLANIYMPDDKEELWSTLIINKDDKRLYNNVQYGVHVDKYNLNSVIFDDEPKGNQKQFNRSVDKKVVARFEFTQITGLHPITVAWISPDGHIFQYTENNLFTDEKDDKPVRMWFWLDLDKEEIYPKGNWKLKFFIDGEFVFEDDFSLVDNSNYSKTGLGN